MQEIKSLSQFNKLKANSLLIIDFHAIWCGPCKAISPIFDRLATQHASSPSIIFAKVDVDKAKDVAQACGITAMPTFQFFKHNRRVDEVKGADPQQLTTKIGYYAAAAANEPAPAAVAETKASAASLRSSIDVAASRLVNASNLSSVRNIASPPPAGYAVASAAGPRVLVHLVFAQAVTPSHVRIVVPGDAVGSAPARIQVGANVVESEGGGGGVVDMRALERAESTQSFNVYSDEYVNGMVELKLKVSKFTGIKSLTIRVDANLSGEETVTSKVKELDIIGVKA